MTSFWKTLPDDLFDRISNLHAGYSNHGYQVDVEPIQGQEELYIATLRDGLEKIDQTLAWVNKQYRTRGRSVRALALLHSYLSEPTWGVSIKVK